MSFETWMGIMEQEMINTSILLKMEEEEFDKLKETYMKRDIWLESYRDGLSPYEALEAEMSYWGEE